MWRISVAYSKPTSSFIHANIHFVIVRRGCCCFPSDVRDRETPSKVRKKTTTTDNRYLDARHRVRAECSMSKQTKNLNKKRTENSENMQTMRTTQQIRNYMLENFQDDDDDMEVSSGCVIIHRFKCDSLFSFRLSDANKYNRRRWEKKAPNESSTTTTAGGKKNGTSGQKWKREHEQTWVPRAQCWATMTRAILTTHQWIQHHPK